MNIIFQFLFKLSNTLSNWKEHKIQQCWVTLDFSEFTFLFIVSHFYLMKVVEARKWSMLVPQLETLCTCLYQLPANGVFIRIKQRNATQSIHFTTRSTLHSHNQRQVKLWNYETKQNPELFNLKHIFIRKKTVGGCFSIYIWNLNKFKNEKHSTTQNCF